MGGGPPPGGLSRSIDEDETLGKIYDREVISRLVKYLAPYKHWVAVGIICVVIVTLSSVAQTWIIRAAINSVTAGVKAQSQGDAGAASRYFRELTIIFAIFIGNGLLYWPASYFQRMSMAYSGQGILLTLRTQMFDHLQKLSLSFYDRNEVGRIMSRVQNDILALQELITAEVLMLIGDALMLGSVVFSLIFMDWQLALITLTVIPLLGVILIIWQRYARRAFIQVRQAIAVVNAELQENISGVRVIQSLSRENVNMRLFDNVNEANLGANLQATRLTAVMQPTVEVLTAVAIALVIIFGGMKVLAGAMSVGTLVAFALFVQRFFQPIRELTMLYTELQRGMAAGVRIFEVLDTKPEVEDAPDAIELPPVKGAVRFDHVSFEYLPGVKVLQDINLDVLPGETIAFVGQTGAGKSTMANLIARFYDATDGSLTVDGYDLRQVTRHSLTRQIAIVLQDPFLFSGTVKDNIRYGRQNATDEEIVAAAKAVGAHDFIQRLEKGYDTEMQERGGNLSAGQRQLVSFARAILADPRILILDEATANVDTQTEILIQNALRQILAGRTSFVIAHRISTTRDANRVVVMDQGRIVEIGSHDELLAKGGLYTNLYTMSYATVASTAS